MVFVEKKNNGAVSLRLMEEKKKKLGEKTWKKNYDSTIKIDEEETRDSAKRKRVCLW
jgi:hypothetical protein